MASGTSNDDDEQREKRGDGKEQDEQALEQALTPPQRVRKQIRGHWNN